jgi:hypothetical protein
MKKMKKVKLNLTPLSVPVTNLCFLPAYRQAGLKRFFKFLVIGLRTHPAIYPYDLNEFF